MAEIVFDPADVAVLAGPLTLREGLVAPNRIAYQPMEGNDALGDGAPSPMTLARYLERATGCAGLEFVEALAVGSSGKARGNQLVLSDATRRGFDALVAKYRNANRKTPILFQLTHSGRFSAEPVTPYPLKDQEAKLLTDADMAAIQEAFVRAAVLAGEAGADGIDFKHCHGYLCGAMLGPANRKRAHWSWGGETLQERSRFFRETLALMKEKASNLFFTLRLSAYEGLPGGFGSRGPDAVEEDPEHRELKAFSEMAAKAGIRLLNVSAGVPERTPLLVRQTNENALGFLDHPRRARIVREASKVPVVGSGYSYLKNGRNRLPGLDGAGKSLIGMGARDLREATVDFVGIGRQCLSDPRFAAKVLEGRFEGIRWDTSCNRCAVSLRSGIPAGCVTYDARYSDAFKKAGI